MIRSACSRSAWFCLILAAAAVGCDSTQRSSRGDTSATVQEIAPRDKSQPPRQGSELDRTKPFETPRSTDSGESGRARAANGSFESNRERELGVANQLSEQGRYREAAEVLKRLLLTDPEDVEVLFTLANVNAALGQFDAAIDLLDTIPRDHPQAGIPALGQSADWCMRLERYDEAEERYRQVLSRSPDAFPARRQLAFLLNRMGRRHEAADQIRELCRIGNVRQDELHSLVMLSHAMYDDPESTGEGAGEFRYTPIGPGGVARKLFTDGRFSEAADAIESWVNEGTAPPAIVALYGRAVVEAQDDRRFLAWLSLVDEATRQTADYWAAMGTYLISQRRFDEATRALLEAADRDPTDMYSFGRLGQTLLTLGQEEDSERWLGRWDEMNELIKANNRVSESSPPDPDQIDELVGLLEKLNRPLEAVLWKSIADAYRGGSPESQEANRSRLGQLVKQEQGFASRRQRLCGLDPEAYPLPQIDELSKTVRLPTRTTRQADTAQPARFENLAEKVGLNHAYQVAAERQTEGFAIYQTYGGAVAVLDFDQDGRPDLYFAQGASDPPSFQGQLSNQLFRNLGGEQRGNAATPPAFSLVDVTESSQSVDFRYSLGVTAGDWNQDGLADLAVANLGEDSLLINNGDGTFTRRGIMAAGDQYRMPSSLAMADINGDSLPDVFELAYVDDPTLILLPKRNEARQVIKAMSPMQYAPGPDRVWINDERGNTTIEFFHTDRSDDRTGLGLVVADFNNEPGNEVFVGNDLYPDQLWVRDPNSGRWSDVAPAVGCAFGIRGSKTASMGIGAGDVDNSGTIDLHITNYQNRNSSLFLNLGESFLERNVQFGLAKASQAVLGFGTQMLDFDNDGRLDMPVTNGHIEKAITIDEPFEQPAQLFRNRGDRFELTKVEDPSGYWDQKHLGRGLARVDINRDGRSDLVITHLGETSALLVNRTVTGNHWLQVQVVGVECERDAVGARVVVESEGERFTSWVTAGDGYLARNEAALHFGLGEDAGPVQVEVHWPSGRTQVFRGVPVDGRILIVEGDEQPFLLEKKTFKAGVE